MISCSLCSGSWYMERTRRINSLSWMFDLDTSSWKPSQSWAVYLVSTAALIFAFFKSLLMILAVLSWRFSASVVFKPTPPSGEAYAEISMLLIFLFSASSMFFTSLPNSLAVFNSLARTLACWIKNMMLASCFSLMIRWKASSPLAGLALPNVCSSISEVEITPSATFTAGIVTVFLPTVALNSRYSSDLAISGT